MTEEGVSDPPTTKRLRRYDLVTNYRCGSAVEEMERSDIDGEWIRYEEYEQLAAQLAATHAASQSEDPCFDRVMEAIANAQRPLQAQLAATHAAIRALPYYSMAPSFVVVRKVNALNCSTGVIEDGESGHWVKYEDLETALARLLGDPAQQKTYEDLDARVDNQ